MENANLEILSPVSEQLLGTTFEAIKAKMIRNQQKYGWTDEWHTRDWEDECRSELMRHIEKGDPKDVLIYAMFMIHHGWSTAKPKTEIGCPFDEEAFNPDKQTI